MGVTKIEWTATMKPDGTVIPGYSFNPWRGCTKVSPGCTHCYAMTMSKRNPSVLGVWGVTGQRAIAAESYWRQALKWNKAAADAGERRRVFCASLADVFEGPETMPGSEWPKVEAARARLWSLIEATPSLDWLLLTKRPENMRAMVPPAWLAAPQQNVWLGTSVEDQQRADERIPYLLRVPARVRFLSCEPLLGPVDLAGWLWEDDGPRYQAGATTGGIHWVICGGESGPHARPMHPDWARSLRNQCQAAKVAYFLKQWGEYAPRVVNPPVMTTAGLAFPDKEIMTRLGKRLAGRQLDGREWNEVPG